MLWHDLWNQISHESHITARSDQLTGNSQWPHGNISRAWGPGFIAISLLSKSTSKDTLLPVVAHGIERLEKLVTSLGTRLLCAKPSTVAAARESAGSAVVSHNRRALGDGSTTYIFHCWQEKPHPQQTARQVKTGWLTVFHDRCWRDNQDGDGLGLAAGWKN